MNARPPRLLTSLLALAAPPDERRDILGDAADEFAARTRDGGPVAARRWYRAQVARSLGPLVARRLSVHRRLKGLHRGIGLDLRVALRALRRSPAFALSVILMLGLAIGAHTTVYAVVDGLLVRPLPFGDRSDRLVTVHSIHPTLAEDWDDAGVSGADAADMRLRARSLERLELAIDRNVSISAGAGTERVLAASVTPGMFSMLGVTPILGRDFRDDDAALPGFEETLLISHVLWQSLFGGAADVVGRPVRLNGRAVPVAGVMPPGFTFPDEHVLWLPFRSPPDAPRGNRSFLAIGLLRPGVTLDQGRADLRRVADVLADEYPDTNRQWTAQAFPIRDFFVSGGDELSVLGGVTLLLLVACANVAGLLIARGAARTRELGIRAALGSGRLRIVRLLTLESAVLAVAGGVFGLALAHSSIRALVAWLPEPPPYWATPAIDLRVAAVAVGVTTLVVLLAGVLPAIRLSRVDAGQAGNGRSTSASRSRRRVERSLVVAQVAASFALVVGGILLSRSATALFTADGGFDKAPLLSFRTYVSGDEFDDQATRTTLVHEVLTRLEQVPGVEAAGATGAIPTDDGGAPARVVPPGQSPEMEFGVQVSWTTSGFWPALALEPLEGRAFTAAEEQDPQAASVVINERLASRLFPGISAVDRTFQMVWPGATTTARVVGVVPNLVYEEFGETTPQSEHFVYMPYRRAGSPRTQAYLVRARDPRAVASAVRDAARSADGGLAVFDMLTMSDRRAYNHWSDRFIGRTFAAFALATLLLACIGAYGLAAFGVAARRREIGVRMAIGAGQLEILRLFLAGGATLACLGTLVGLPIAIVVASTLEHDLFGTTPWTPSIWILPPVLLVTAVLAASYFPARRASCTDPLAALRSE